MVKILPFQLQDGQKSYAAKLMGNFNYLLGITGNINIDGISGELEDVLRTFKALIEEKVSIGEQGNANHIRFDDGVTLQDKLPEMHGRDGLTSLLNGFYYFTVDENNHLKVTARSEEVASAFSLQNGHLLYTLPDVTDDEGSPVTYDLGLITPDHMLGIVYDTHNRKTDIYDYVDEAIAEITPQRQSASYNVTLYAGSFSGGATSVDVELEQMTANSNFIVGTAEDATQAERREWQKGKFAVTGQAAGSFTLMLDGEAPENDIPLSVVIMP